MPLPVPHKGERNKDFLKRCMGDAEAVRTFPDGAQRYAVCLKQSRIRGGPAAADRPELPAAIRLSGTVSIVDAPDRGGSGVQASERDEGDEPPRIDREN